MSVKRKIIKFAIDKAKRSKLMQSVFEAPMDLESMECFGHFTDHHGQKHTLYKELRNKLKPGWESMLVAKRVDTSKEMAQTKVRDGRIAIERLKPILATFGKSIEANAVLEIGCHAGATSYAFAEAGASTVIGTDFNEFKVSSTKTGELNEDEIVAMDMAKLQKNVADQFPDIHQVNLLNDDICNTTLPENSFDIITSWDVLEHLHDPAAAFKNFAKLLKPGGVAINQYNSFFCMIGGHSLCTLDFPWGHVRLNDDDVVRYLDEIRPNEKEKALSFYRNGVNRMTIADMIRYSDASGLKTTIIPFPKEQHLRMVNEQILEESQRNYPNLTINDLVTPKIIVVHEKVGSP